METAQLTIANEKWSMFLKVINEQEIGFDVQEAGPTHTIVWIHFKRMTEAYYFGYAFALEVAQNIINNNKATV